MKRCLQLAALGKGSVEPNPVVGAVLVYNDEIIGEGYHQQWGKAHAEVNCIASVKPTNQHLISDATLYVSLEPCAHFGKTPPCADLILQHHIKKVVVGCKDDFAKVNGKGIEKLKAAGVDVRVGVLEEECIKINTRFFYFNTQHQPYVILKWAQTADGKIAGAENARMFITNEFTNRIVHKWRSEEAAILVGTNTALADDPELTTRLWPGKNPVRLLIDKNLKIPSSAKILNGNKTIVFNLQKHEEAEHLLYYRITNDVSVVQQVLNALYQLKIQSVIVEGGAQLLQSFIEEGAWNEARVITNTQMIAGEGLAAPVLKQAKLHHEEKFLWDEVKYYFRDLNIC